MDLLVEDALDDCMRRLEHEGLEVCLRRYPQYRAELEPLLRLSVNMRQTLTRVEPRPAARAAIRQRVLAATQGTPALPATPPTASSRNGAAPTAPITLPNRPRLVASDTPRAVSGARRPLPMVARPWQIAAAVILLLLAGFGLSWPVAAASLPGDPLYGEKLAGENVRLALAGDTATTASVHFEFAERRAGEVATLVAQGRAHLAPVALQGMAAHTQAGLTALDRTSGPQQAVLLDKLARVTNREESVLQALAPRLAQDSGNAATLIAYQAADSTLAAGRTRLEQGTPVAGIGAESSPTPRPPTASLTPAAQVPAAVATALPATVPPGPPTVTPDAVDTSTPPAASPTPPAAAGRATETHLPPGLQRTPPGQGGTPPGQARTVTPPGRQRTPPGQARTVTPPGQGNPPPGQGGTPPGKGGTPPGLQRTVVPPGHAADPPTPRPTATPTRAPVPPAQVAAPTSTPQPAASPTPENNGNGNSNGNGNGNGKGNGKGNGRGNGGGNGGGGNSGGGNGGGNSGSNGGGNSGGGNGGGNGKGGHP